MKRIPAIKSVMTPFPYSVDNSDSIEHAQQFLRQHVIHHLPVTEKGELIGILTDRDISLYLDAGSGDTELQKAQVRDISMGEPYIVDLNERLDNVLQTMAKQKKDAVLVTRHGKLAGVFTYSDACRSFSDYLREQFKPPGGSDAA